MQVLEEVVGVADTLGAPGAIGVGGRGGRVVARPHGLSYGTEETTVRKRAVTEVTWSPGHLAK